MKLQGWASFSLSLLCLLCALLGGGCACVDSCCTSNYDFAGCGCTQRCGSESQPIVDSLGEIGHNLRAQCAHGGACGAACDCLSCANWGKREVFIDGCGRPCYGPIASIAMLFRDGLKNCGCGELYVDEWISDPPLCNDPCGAGCTACASCGPYVGSGGCAGGGGILDCLCSGCSAGGCSAGGCTGGGCTGCSSGGCAATGVGLIEPDCGIQTGSCLLEPDCGIQTTGSCSCSIEPSCGCAVAAGGAACSCAAKVACGCGKIGCGRIAKGVLSGTATAVGNKVEHFLADRKYKWSQRGRARSCNNNCQQIAQDIPDYRFDNPGVHAAPAVSTNSCQCANCKTKSGHVSTKNLTKTQARNEANRVAQLQRVNNNVRQVQHLSDR